MKAARIELTVDGSFVFEGEWVDGIDFGSNWSSTDEGHRTVRYERSFPALGIADAGGALEAATSQASQAPSSEEEDASFSFFEVLLQDEAGQPVARERCRIKYPDGEVRETTTDGAGLIRFSPAPKGSFEVCFVDLDEEAWERKT